MIADRQMPPKIGLALSGGGIRGTSHIGVLKVFEEEGIPIGFLAGTSMGGLVSAIYAAGLSAAEIEAEAIRMSQPRQMLALIDRKLPRRGLLEGDRVEAYLAHWLQGLTFDELRLPLSVVATDVNRMERVVLCQGPVLEAVRATIAVPGLFPPVKHGDQALIDGGVVDNIPVGVVREMGAEIVVAVDVTTAPGSIDPVIGGLYQRRLMPESLVDTAGVLWRSLVFLIWKVSQGVLEENPPDLLIRPLVPQGVTALTGFKRIAEAIAAGEVAARAAMPRLRELLR